MKRILEVEIRRTENAIVLVAVDDSDPRFAGFFSETPGDERWRQGDAFIEHAVLSNRSVLINADWGPCYGTDEYEVESIDPPAEERVGDNPDIDLTTAPAAPP